MENPAELALTKSEVQCTLESWEEGFGIDELIMLTSPIYDRYAHANVNKSTTEQ